jgi:3-hydroxy acid dehydrogenase/malonic semialdehyde reductase
LKTLIVGLVLKNLFNLKNLLNPGFIFKIRFIPVNKIKNIISLPIVTIPMAKIALITGATAGIGEACAHTFAREGYNLILTGRRMDRLETLAQHLNDKYNVEVAVASFDVRSREQVVKSLEDLPETWKMVDVLVNNAGLSQGLDPIQSGSYDDWDTMIDTNIKGLLYVSRVVSNWMISNGFGHIINLGSIAGKEVYPNGNVYCATKHAVDALNKGMRLDLLQYGIRVTGIHPGAVETEFSEVRFKGDKERAKKVYEGFEPLVADDVAETIWFVASRPAHVNINDLVIMPTAQAAATNIFRK